MIKIHYQNLKLLIQKGNYLANLYYNKKKILAVNWSRKTYSIEALLVG